MINEIPNIKKERLRKTLTFENIKVLEMNIEYPVFNRNEVDADYKSINDFYKKLSDNYINYCELVLYNRIKKHYTHNDNIKPFGEIMKFFAPHNSKDYVSVICEITHFDGYFKRTTRINQTWQYKDNIMLPANYFYKKIGMSHKKIKKYIGDIIMEKIKNGNADFSYTDKSVRKYAYNVNTNNYYLCKKGVAFWFDTGTIAPESEGFPAFVIPYKEKEELSN
ncbi:MAG: DUF3298 domain-containing protein [Clostridia bacterium]|nr:DUF3298 domain-containing protein [Clostridia bacterium]